MRILGPTSLTVVEQQLAAGRDLRAGSAPWTLRFLAAAEIQFAGAWTDVEISGAEACAILLPAHDGEPCQGDRLMLVGPGGSTVQVAANRLGAMADDYARGNPTCWSRVSEAMHAPFSSVVLTTAPLNLPEYHGLSAPEAPLIHLDGFHRLVAWALAGRLTAEATIRAAVAGRM